jgi:PleD family two-component response regulator
VAEKVRALNLGAVDYLSKPFQALELLSRTERAIALRRPPAPAEPPRGPVPVGSDLQTGLFDRPGLLARLEHEVSRSMRYQRPLSLAVLFPQGEVSEHVRNCAALIRGRLRAPDLLGHLGEGVFAMVLPESPVGAARGICARIIPELYRMTGIVFQNKTTDVGKDGRSAAAVLDQLMNGYSKGS